MNTSGDAAEQIVRMSLEGFEVAAKITGAGAKNIAVLLYAILKEEKKTKGKARLTNMLRSGKELKVFTVRQGDLKKFTQEAKKYGVLYCVLTDRQNKDPKGQMVSFLFHRQSLLYLACSLALAGLFFSRLLYISVWISPITSRIPPSSALKSCVSILAYSPGSLLKSKPLVSTP